MFVTSVLLIYFILSVLGIYSSISNYKKDIESTNHRPASIVVLILFLIIFSVIYTKHIIISYFVIWFIFDMFTGIILVILRRNKTHITMTPTRCIWNVVCGILSCMGVLYILL